MYKFLFLFKVIFFQINLYCAILLISSVFLLSGCGSGNEATSKNLVKTPILSLITPTPSMNKKPLFEVANLEIGGDVGIYSDSNCTQYIRIDLSSITPISIGITRLTILNEIPTDGNYSYYAKQTNKDGKISSCSSGISYKLDTVAPSVSFELTIQSLSNVANPVLNTTGTIELGDIIEVFIDDTCTDKPTQSISNGQLTLTLTRDRNYTFYTKQSDQAGNKTPCAIIGINYTLDRVVLTPTLLQVTSSPSNELRPTFSLGNIESGATIILYLDSRCFGSELAAIKTNNNIKLDADLNGGDITYSFYAKQIDRAGNVSNCTANGVNYELDTTALTPLLSLIGSSSSNNSNPAFNIADLEIGGTVQLYSNGNCTALVENKIIEGNKMKIILSSALIEYRTKYFSAKQIDSLGNESDCSRKIEYTLLTDCSEKTFAASDSSSSITEDRISCSISYSESGTFFGACQDVSSNFYFEGEGINREKVYMRAEGSCQYSCSNNIWTKIKNNCNQVVQREPAVQYARKIFSGRRHSCVLLSDKTVKCWGDNSSGQLGATSSDTCFVDNNQDYPCSKTPLTVSDLSNVRQIALGQNHTCAILGDDISTPSNEEGTVKCWGNNASHNLSATSTDICFRGNDYAYSCSKTPLTVSSLSGVNQLALGDAVSCAFLNDKTVKCWGGGGHGKTPYIIPNLSNVTQIYSGYSHHCALLNDGTVKCWGGNHHGELGNGNTRAPVFTPTAVSNLSNVNQITLGYSHSCALLNDGSVKCWGDDTYGKVGGVALGYAITAPVVISNLSNVSQIYSAGNRTCVVLNDNTVKCWGDNRYGQFGNGSFTGSSTPVTASSLNNISQLALGSDHTCMISDNKTVKCWGDNRYGQLGGGSSRNSERPVAISDLNNISQVAVGSGHSCALLNDGTAKCWGDNRYGQLGEGIEERRRTSAIVSGLGDASQIALGDNHSCALLNDKTVKCWGNNSVGQLGTTSADICKLNYFYRKYHCSRTAIAVSGLSNVNQIFLNRFQSCALINDGTVKCWGGVYGKIPVIVSDLSNVSQISLGYDHSCVVLNDGTVKCWGYNYLGQLGDGSRNSSSVPVGVLYLSNVSQISSGGTDHTCALLNDNIDTTDIDEGGTVKCWGTESFGLLNLTRTRGYSTRPVEISSLSDVGQISTIGNRTCALLNDGTVKCWGDNREGRLGNVSEDICRPWGTIKDCNKTPVTVPSLSNVSQISLGYGHSCALLDDDVSTLFNEAGTVKCWGDDYYFGQLGFSNISDKYSLIPILIPTFPAEIP